MAVLGVVFMRFSDRFDDVKYRLPRTDVACLLPVSCIGSGGERGYTVSHMEPRLFLRIRDIDLDFQIHAGRTFRMLTVIDEYSRQCLASRTERRQNQETILETLAAPFLLHDPPDYICSDNGAEFTATAVRK